MEQPFPPWSGRCKLKAATVIFARGAHRSLDQRRARMLALSRRAAPEGINGGDKVRVQVLDVRV